MKDSFRPLGKTQTFHTRSGLFEVFLVFFLQLGIILTRLSSVTLFAHVDHRYAWLFEVQSSVNFQLTKADFPPCPEPLVPLVAVYDSVFLCSVRLLSQSCCLIWASPSQEEEEGGLLGQVWLQPCLWTASGQGRVCALSVQSMNGTCTRGAARGKLWACSHCYFLHLEKDFGEGFLPWLPY